MNVRLRPRFDLVVSLSPDEVMARFRQRIDAGNQPCRLSLLERQVEVSVRAEHQHFWSPFLNMLVYPDEGRTILRGKFGPNVNVWTFFLALYAILSLTGTTGFIAATSQLQIGEAPTGFYLTAACLVLAGLVWLAGQLGQRLAHDQIEHIHAYVHEVLADVLIAPEAAGT
jgi:hypothetical protein